LSPLLIAFLVILLVPLFVATWRTSLLGLACQGLLMAWIAYRLVPPPGAPSDWLTIAGFVIVRGLGAPLALYGVRRRQNAPSRNDVIPANLLSWTAALAMVLVAFNFAELLVHEDGDQRTLVAVSIAGLMLGFLVLATQPDPFSQMIGALRIENAIALFELGGGRHHPSLGLQIALLLVVIATIVLFRAYLVMTGEVSAPVPVARPSSPPEAPTL
jgi:hydrogenase-4 membrane subunit HyfE